MRIGPVQLSIVIIAVRRVITNARVALSRIADAFADHRMMEFGGTTTLDVMQSRIGSGRTFENVFTIAYTEIAF